MGTLYLDKKEIYVKVDGDALAVYSNNKREGNIPINPLDRVVIIGNITLEASVLHKLAEKSITVVFLSGKQLKFRGMLHGKLHKNGLLRLRQYEKTKTSFGMIIARNLVRRKIEAQIQLLQDALKQRPDLKSNIDKSLGTLKTVRKNLDYPGLKPETLLGMGGGCSSAYFTAYTTLFPPSLNFKTRTRRPPTDPVNAMLSLCYTLLHYELVKEIETIGLDPVIGFYHKFDYGRESLACDLAEPYRPEVDKFVWIAFRERLFTVKDFVHGGERPGCYLKKNSRKRFYPLYEQWARELRPKLVREVQSLARSILDGQDPVSERETRPDRTP